MKRTVLVFAALATSLPAQAPVTSPHLPRGVATYVTNSEIQATVQKTATAKVNDTQIKVVNITGSHDDDYNVAIGILHRANTAAHGAGGGLEHEYVTEVYQIVSGTGTFVTGGNLENPKESAPDSQIVKVLDGATVTGGPVIGGVSRKVGPGDMIISPPNTPHWFSEITSDQVVYTVVRIDPKKVLPAGYDSTKQ
jgi:mannose-6-phosphate isomerase-like protein (cupin superfamily)